jgi:tripartite motif-containing protein 71
MHTHRPGSRQPTPRSVLLGLTLTAGLLTCFSAAPARAEDPPRFITKFGWCGYGNGQMSSLGGIAALSDGSLLVVQQFEGKVSRFAPDTSFVLSWPVDGPFGIAVAPDGTVFVTRPNAARVEHYTSSGGLLGAFGSPGAGDGQFSQPYGVTVDAQGHVLVLDSYNHRVQIFAEDGTFLGKWGHAGRQVGELDGPSAIAAGVAGDVFVIDGGVARVYRFSETGVLLNWWHSAGSSPFPFAPRYGLAVDQLGGVYLVDGSLNIEKFTPTGELLTTWGGYGDLPGQFFEAYTLATAPGGRVYVSDDLKCRIQVFGADVPVPAQPSSWGAVKAHYR